jgi:hypothetical protein
MSHDDVDSHNQELDEKLNVKIKKPSLVNFRQAKSYITKFKKHSFKEGDEEIGAELTFQTGARSDGTSRQGSIIATYSQLVNIFGLPDFGPNDRNGDKVTCEWDIEFNDGTLATIYDWKENKTPMDEYEWNVGGNNKQAVWHVMNVLKNKSVDEAAHKSSKTYYFDLRKTRGSFTNQQLFDLGLQPTEGHDWYYRAKNGDLEHLKYITRTIGVYPKPRPPGIEEGQIDEALPPNVLSKLQSIRSQVPRAGAQTPSAPIDPSGDEAKAWLSRMTSNDDADDDKSETPLNFDRPGRPRAMSYNEMLDKINKLKTIKELIKNISKAEPRAEKISQKTGGHEELLAKAQAIHDMLDSLNSTYAREQELDNIEHRLSEYLKILHAKVLSWSKHSNKTMQKRKSGPVTIIRPNEEMTEARLTMNRRTGQMELDKEDLDQRHGLYIDNKLIKTYATRKQAERIKQRDPKFRDAVIKKIAEDRTDKNEMTEASIKKAGRYINAVTPQHIAKLGRIESDLYKKVK